MVERAVWLACGDGGPDCGGYDGDDQDEEERDPVDGGVAGAGGMDLVARGRDVEEVAGEVLRGQGEDVGRATG